MLKRKMTLALFLMASVAFISGCAGTSVYVLNEAELMRVKKDQTVTARYDGWMLSDRAVDRVMNAKIKAVNLE